MFTAGDYCRPCECSGNINPDDPGSCDSVTGECLRCLNNTFGMACNLCAPGYFGDAVHLKDCQSKYFMDNAGNEVTGEWRKLHNEELNDLYCSPNIVRVIKSRRMRWAGHVACMGERRGVYRVLVGKPERKRPLGRLRRMGR